MWQQTDLKLSAAQWLIHRKIWVTHTHTQTLTRAHTHTQTQVEEEDAANTHPDPPVLVQFELADEHWVVAAAEIVETRESVSVCVCVTLLSSGSDDR